MQYHIPEEIFKGFRDNIYDTQQRLYTKRSLSTGLVRQKSDRRDIESEYEENKQEQLIYAFKLYLKNEFEGILKDTDHVIYNNDSLIEISHIHLGFDHVNLHYMLMNRGKAIKNGDNEKKEMIENQIVKYLQDNKEQISTPKDAYIIFETEEAFHRAMKFNSVVKCGREIATRRWKGTNLILSNVKEPSNLTFEHKYKNPLATTIRIILVGIILLLALMTTCYLIFYFQDKVNRLNRQYPEVNCKHVIRGK